jgi:hypothetical protein
LQWQRRERALRMRGVMSEDEMLPPHVVREPVYRAALERAIDASPAPRVVAERLFDELVVGELPFQ